jgi:hypothetical protein
MLTSITPIRITTVPANCVALSANKGTLPLPIRQLAFSIPDKAWASEEAPRPTVETIGVACLCQRVRRVATDRSIDKLMYELYGLTNEEIKLVENQS